MSHNVASSWQKLTCLIEIWLVWWTEDNGHHIGKYISVYIILAVAGSIFRAGTIWLALRVLDEAVY